MDILDGKGGIVQEPPVSVCSEKLGAFPVRRGTADISSIKHTYKLLEENKIVGIFPHGTRVKPSKETAR